MNKKTKILYVGNNLLNKSGYTSTIVILSNLLKNKFEVVVVSNKINKVLRLFDMCWAVLTNYKSVKYILIDTYSTTNFYYALIISQLARFLKVNYISILHGGNLPNRLIKNRFYCKLIFNNSYKNVAPSNYLKQAFEKEGYKTVFIPNILEINKYKVKKRRIFKPNLLWVRAFSKIYNPTMAIKVLNLIKKEYPKAKLCMIGPKIDDSFNQTMLLIDKFKLSESVEIMGLMSKKGWLKKSEYYDVFINTTNFDNTPISLMEAMALGLPIISTNVGGISFLIHDKQDGILVEKDDSTQMAKEIVNLLENPKFANKLALRARKKVELFDCEQVKKIWFKVLK